MERQCVDAAEVAVIVADHLVRLQIPAFDHLVLATGEQVRVSWRHGQAAHSADVPRQRQPQRSRSEIPDLDGPVASAAGKPLVSRLDGQAAHPAQVA